MAYKLIKFEKENCAPCQMMQNLLDDLGVDVTKYQVFDNPELAGQYNVGSVPTLILADDEGNEITRSIGFKPNEIEDMAESFKNK